MLMLISTSGTNAAAEAMEFTALTACVDRLKTLRGFPHKGMK